MKSISALASPIISQSRPSTTKSGMDNRISSESPSSSRPTMTVVGAVVQKIA